MLNQKKYSLQKNGISVQLIDATDSPLNLSVAAARTCYSSRGPVFPDEVAKDEKSTALRDRIAESTLKAGHLTTRQHAHFTFVIDGVSRQLIWSFLHSHTMYNSEQVSQRYVPVQKDRYYIPPSLRQQKTTQDKKAYEIYIQAMERASEVYRELTELLIPVVEKEYYRIFPGRAKNRSKYQPAVQKKAMEAARYVLPVATTAYLYHTISQLTLYRYVRLMNRLDLPEEARDLIGMMVELAVAFDPGLVHEIPDPTPLEQTREYKILSLFSSKNNQLDPAGALAFIKEFDRPDSNDHPRNRDFFSRLIQYPENAEHLLGTIYAARFAKSLSNPKDPFSDHSLWIRELLDPELNPAAGSTLGESFADQDGRILDQFSLTYKKKISHTADSQDQRHRATPGVRPYLLRHFTGKPDAITPLVIQKDPGALDLYSSFLEEHFERLNRFVDVANEPAHLAYLIPNSFPIRFYQSGTLGGWSHRFRTRSCYNAQEEIFYATIDEITAFEKALPSFRALFRPPCDFRKRAGIRPPCPEGDRFCGVAVWKLELDQYDRIL